MNREQAALADQIRGSQIHAMEANVWKSLVGYLVAASLGMAVAYQDWSGLLNVWGPAVFLACIARILLALHTAMRPVRPRSERSEQYLMVATTGLSIVMAVGPAWIALRSDGLVSATMITLIVSSMWGGAIVQAPLFSASASYTGVNIPVWLLSLSMTTITWDRVFLSLLFVATVVVALDNIYRYAKNFERGQRQQIDLVAQSARLEQQTEVIGLLLKDHEDQSSDWLWQVDANGLIRNPSSRFAEALSANQGALNGQALAALLSEPDIAGNTQALAVLTDHIATSRSFRDLIIPGSNGDTHRWWSISGRPTLNENGLVVGYRGVMADVTAAKQAQAQVIHLAHHDALTGLANRAYFHERTNALLKSADSCSFGLISIDLDGFKPVNDRYGHPVGDELLIAASRRLSDVVGGRGLVGRLGGDEFAVVINISQPGEMDAFCARLVKALAQPFEITDHGITIGASIGVAFAPADGRTTEMLFKNADAALYRAKRDGRGTYRFFAPEMDHHLQERMVLLQDLRDALPRKEFELHYQPFVDANTGDVTGCEALIRWNHPLRGQISPADFIPLAEESGMIVQIGAWVMATACAEAATWPGDRRVSVNISPAQFADRELPAHILEALVAAGLSPHRLEVEVTEAVLIEDAELALDILRRINALGVKIALDDFGTGYSSLSYLRNFPFDKVKIDRSFVTEIESRRDSQVIIQGIHDIALGLGMTVTAEGVETLGQVAELRKSGCHELQGFLFSKPQRASEVPDLFTLGRWSETSLQSAVG
ncbi:hypothetical protein WH87_05270 [Devosia epidermidihirudinis]|uniref:Diguanylate cyclase n=1 Tax=Devosia epidermidihirudinis TaxID=1293439 RepID=A0A0F5QFW3_9HYPH|nr:EAL domain-containing protein [Devosia epidermidihirudinis]KKC39583.1 hypothetical protein WH87_05270 [Devosia epidermidihirudinis]